MKNILKLVKAAKAQASAKVDNEWLSKAQNIKDYASKIAIPAANIVFEKHPSIKMSTLEGTAENPDILVVKAISEPHESNTPDKTKVFEVELLFSEHDELPPGKYNVWYGYTIFNDEMDTYIAQEGNNGKITGNTFVIASCGKTIPKNPRNKPAKILRVFPAPQ